jgi:hypothetical protein
MGTLLADLVYTIKKIPVLKIELIHAQQVFIFPL